MKKTILPILIALLTLCVSGCGMMPGGTAGTEETATEAAVTEDPVAVFKTKVHNRIASDVKYICDNKGISPGNTFFMSFTDVLNRFVKNRSSTFYSCEEALKSGALTYAEKNNLIDEISKSGLTADNVFIYRVRGRVMKNPAVDFLLTEETTALRIAVIYSANTDLYGHSVLEVNENLNTCVIITVTKF